MKELFGATAKSEVVRWPPAGTSNGFSGAITRTSGVVGIDSWYRAALSERFRTLTRIDPVTSSPSVVNGAPVPRSTVTSMSLLRAPKAMSAPRSTARITG